MTKQAESDRIYSLKRCINRDGRVRKARVLDEVLSIEGLELNPRPTDYESVALPTELQQHAGQFIPVEILVWQACDGKLNRFCGKVLYLVTLPSLLEAKVATFRKRDNKWQAIVRHKSIGTKARSFHSKAQAKLWAIETEKSIEANTFNKLCPSSVTLGNLLNRYLREITPKKRGRDNESRRIQRLLKDTVSLTSMDKLTSACLAQFRV